MSWFMLPLRAVSGFMAQHHQGSVSMSVTHVATKDSCFWSGVLFVAMLISEECTELAVCHRLRHCEELAMTSHVVPLEKLAPCT